MSKEYNNRWNKPLVNPPEANDAQLSLFDDASGPAPQPPAFTYAPGIDLEQWVKSLPVGTVLQLNNMGKFKVLAAVMADQSPTRIYVLGE